MTNLNSDPWFLAVTMENFDNQLAHICKNYNPISLTDLINFIDTGNIPDKSVVLTFDDGYQDNFINAKPLLEKYSIPATIFVTCDYIGGRSEFWWDDLERIMLLQEKLPNLLQLKIQNNIYKWLINSKEDLKSINEIKWNVDSKVNPIAYRRLYEELHRLLKPLDNSERKLIMQSLHKWSLLPDEGRLSYRTLDQNEIKTLAAGDRIDIGSHTMTHPSLSDQTIETQTWEIRESKHCLENILGRQITAFSYPYGSEASIGDNAPELVKNAGFQTACVNFEGTINTHSDKFMLPRFRVKNWNIAEFAKYLNKSFR